MDFWINLMSRQWPNACWIAIYVICLFLLFKNRDRWDVKVKGIIVVSVITILFYFCPFSAKIIQKYFLKGPGEYERIAWLLFIIPVIAYTFVKVLFDLKKNQRVKASIVFVVLCAFLSGLPFLTKEFKVPENQYKLTDDAIEVSNAITDDANCYGNDQLLGTRQVSYDDKGKAIKPTVLIQVEKHDHLASRDIYYCIRQYASAPVLTPVIIPQTVYNSSSFNISKYANMLNYEYFVCTDNEYLRRQAELQGFELLKKVDNYAVYKNTKEITLYFIRHGETEANVNNVLAGSKTDTKLTENGIKGAKVAGDALKNVPFSLVYTSELTRTKDTAKYILGENKNKVPNESVSQALNDIYVGELEGLSKEEVLQKYPDYNEDTYYGKISDSKFVSPVGATSKYKIVQNYKSALYSIIAKAPNDSNVLVVGHGALAWMFNSMFPNEVSDTSLLDNTSITVLKYNKGKYEIEAYNADASQFKEIEQ